MACRHNEWLHNCLKEEKNAKNVQIRHGHFFHIYFFLLTLGPPLPKVLSSFSLVEIQGDAFIFGGYFGSLNSAIYKLTCSSGICSWSTLNQELKVARYVTVAIPVPDTFCV